MYIMNTSLYLPAIYIPGARIAHIGIRLGVRVTPYVHTYVRNLYM